MKRLTDHSFVADTPLVSVGRDEIDFLKAELRRSNIDGIRLTLTPDPNSLLREAIQAPQAAQIRQAVQAGARSVDPCPGRNCGRCFL